MDPFTGSACRVRDISLVLSPSRFTSYLIIFYVLLKVCEKPVFQRVNMY